MGESLDRVKFLQEKIWGGSIPLQIVLSPLESRTDDTLPYWVQYPRVSYLTSLFPKLHTFFFPDPINSEVGAHEAWLSFEGVPLKWQHPLGLLYDLFSGSEAAEVNRPPSKHRSNSVGEIESEDSTTILPWKLVLHYSDWPVEHLIPLDPAWKIPNDVFINSVKEADFLRNGTGKVMMSLSKDDSTKLWTSVQSMDLQTFRTINHKFLNPPGGTPLRHIPLKVYLPTTTNGTESLQQPQAVMRVIQGLVTPMLSPREPQTLGTALHGLLPTVFPSRRSYIHAQAVLHGAVAPLAANLQDLMRGAAYADGFLHIVVAMVG